MGGFSPFNAGFNSDMFAPDIESEEEKRRRMMEEAERSQLSQAMDTEPKWGDPEEYEAERQETRNPGSIDEPEPQEDYLSDYAKHLGERPEEGDYEPGTLRKILSVLGGTAAGGDPRVTRQLAGYGGYDRDLAAWEAKGEGLGEVAGFERDRYRTDTTRRGQNITRQGDVEDFNLGGRNATTSEGNLSVREGELSEKERAALIAEKDVGVGRTLEGRRASTGEENARISADRAASYDENVESLGKYRAGRLEQGAGSGGDPNLSPSQQGNLDLLALQDVISNHPEWEKFARFADEGEGDVEGIEATQPGGFFGSDTDSSEDNDYQRFMLAYEMARQTRAGTAGLEDIPAYGGQ